MFRRRCNIPVPNKPSRRRNFHICAEPSAIGVVCEIALSHILRRICFAFYVRFCQVSFVTFSYFSYIRSMISLTHVTIGVVCCQNPNLLHLCFCFSKDIFLHFTPAAGKPSFPTFHRPRTFQTFADNMPHAKNV